jgi:hypothetical protein
MKTTVKLLPLLICVSAGSLIAFAQTPESEPTRWEIGGRFTSLTGEAYYPPVPASAPPEFRSVFIVPRATKNGFGGRVVFNLNRSVALEAEANFFPRIDFNRTETNGGRLAQNFFGIKAGKRFSKFGLFAKARPGFARFSRVDVVRGLTTQPLPFGDGATLVPDIQTKPRYSAALDLGGVVEFYPSQRVVARIDVGDTIIRYGPRNGVVFIPTSNNNNFLSLPTLIPFGAQTKHNFQFSVGVGFCF